MEILSQEQEQNQVQEPIAEQYAEWSGVRPTFTDRKMLKHLTGKPADHPISYWRTRFGGVQISSAPPERSDGHFWDQEACKERCASNTPILVDCLENDKRRGIVTHPWWLKNALKACVKKPHKKTCWFCI